MAHGNKPSRQQWGSRLAFLFSAFGAAIGLGNIWKFPYIVGKNGGSAFIFVYLICLALIGLPILFAEIFCGQQGQCNPIGAFQRANATRRWLFVPIVGFIGAYFVFSFYAVVGGWIVRHTVGAITGDLLAPEGLVGGTFGSIEVQFFYHALFLAGVFAVNIGGIQRGIELFNKIAIPGLFIVLAGLFAYSATLPGFASSCRFLFDPQFSLMTVGGVMEAIGHGFFTLGVGVCALMAYGSFMSKSYDVASLSLMTAVVDTIIALMCGIVIFSVVFSFGLEPGEGETLIFVTLPRLFGSIPGGEIVAGLFFVLVLFSALTSAISMLEPVINTIEERWQLSRQWACGIVWFASHCLGVAVILSLSNVWSIKIFGLNLFEALDKTTTHILMPMVGVGTAFFVGWKMDAPLREQLSARPFLYRYISWSLKLVAPVGIIVVVLQAFWDQL